jgi:hypothetical protein
MSEILKEWIGKNISLRIKGGETSMTCVKLINVDELGILVWDKECRDMENEAIEPDILEYVLFANIDEIVVTRDIANNTRTLKEMLNIKQGKNI